MKWAGENMENESLMKVNRTRLNDQEKELYDIIFSAIEREEHIIYFDAPTPHDIDLNLVDVSVIHDCPFTYYVHPIHSMVFTHLDEKIRIEINYIYGKDERRMMKSLMNRKISQIKSLCLEKCDTDVEKELFIHDHLANTVNYTHETLVKDLSEYSAAGALIDGKAVCMGIAKATCILLNAVGVECGCLTNDTHMWNVVRIEGKLYNLDVTWDLKENYVTHDHFNLSDAMSMRDYVNEKGPVCNSEEHNWYRINGRDLNNVEELYILLKEMVYRRESTVDFRMLGSVTDDISDFIRDMLTDLRCDCRWYINKRQMTYHLMFTYF